MPRKTKKSKKSRDAIARTSRRPVKRQRTDTERLTEFEDWLIDGEEDDESVTVQFDAKARLIRIGTASGKDLRSTLDSFLQHEEDAHFLLTHTSGQELKRIVRSAMKEIDSNPKKARKR
jgi:hypothetical protein